MLVKQRSDLCMILNQHRGILAVIMMNTSGGYLDVRIIASVDVILRVTSVQDSTDKSLKMLLVRAGYVR